VVRITCNSLIVRVIGAVSVIVLSKKIEKSLVLKLIRGYFAIKLELHYTIIIL